MTNGELTQTRRRQPASIELVVLGLLAALIVVLAIPLISQATNPTARLDAGQSDNAQ